MSWLQGSERRRTTGCRRPGRPRNSLTKLYDGGCWDRTGVIEPCRLSSKPLGGLLAAHALTLYQKPLISESMGLMTT
jgi:hypothetical protein